MKKRRKKKKASPIQQRPTRQLIPKAKKKRNKQAKDGNKSWN